MAANGSNLTQKESWQSSAEVLPCGGKGRLEVHGPCLPFPSTQPSWGVLLEMHLHTSGGEPHISIDHLSIYILDIYIYTAPCKWGERSPLHCWLEVISTQPWRGHCKAACKRPWPEPFAGSTMGKDQYLQEGLVALCWPRSRRGFLGQLVSVHAVEVSWSKWESKVRRIVPGHKTILWGWAGWWKTRLLASDTCKAIRWIQAEMQCSQMQSIGAIWVLVGTGAVWFKWPCGAGNLLCCISPEWGLQNLVIWLWGSLEQEEWAWTQICLALCITAWPFESMGHTGLEDQT